MAKWIFSVIKNQSIKESATLGLLPGWVQFGSSLGGLGQPLIPMEFSMDGDGRVLFYAQSNVEVHVCDTSLFVLPIIKGK